MNCLNVKAFFSLFVFQSMALSFFLTPSSAYAETHSTPAPVKQWADPGAMEKAKTDTAPPASNTSTPPAAVSTKPVEQDGKTAPGATSPTSESYQKAASKHEKSKHNKITPQPDQDKAAKSAEASRSVADQVKSSHAAKSVTSEGKALAHSHEQLTPHRKDVRANNEAKSKPSAKQVKSSRARHGAATTGNADAVQETFDPLNGL